MITEATHPHYRKRKRDWLLIRRMLTGEEAEKELNKRYFEEHPQHWKQRKRDADHTPLTRRHVQRIVGMLFERKGDVARETGPISGLDAVGPEGESYEVQLIALAAKLLAYHEAYVVFQPAGGLAVVGPMSVPVWNQQSKVVKGSRVPDQSVFAEIQEWDTWTRYTARGYEVFRQVEGEGGKEKDERIDKGIWAVNEDGESDAFFVDQDGQAMPPVLRVRLPWEARFGYMLAKKHRAIFEMRSRRDFAASTSMNGLLQVGVGKTQGDEDFAGMIRSAIEKSRILPYRTDYGEHKGIAYPTDGIKEGTKIIQEKEKEMDEVAFKLLDEATRKTATEAALQHAGGAAAALTVLASTIESAEERILRVMAQAEDMRLAGPGPEPVNITVEWPEDYSGVADAQALVDRVFPSGIPIDAETATTIIVDHLQDHGYSEEELERAQIKGRVESRIARESREEASVSPFGTAD